MRLPLDVETEEFLCESEICFGLLRKHFEGELNLFDPEDAVRRYLVRRVVFGVTKGACDEPGAPPEEIQERVEELMMMMEVRSLELQRHCPEDWNQYLALISQCFVQKAPRQRSRHFKV